MARGLAWCRRAEGRVPPARTRACRHSDTRKRCTAIRGSAGRRIRRRSHSSGRGDRRRAAPMHAGRSGRSGAPRDRTRCDRRALRVATRPARRSTFPTTPTAHCPSPRARSMLPSRVGPTRRTRRRPAPAPIRRERDFAGASSDRRVEERQTHLVLGALAPPHRFSTTSRVVGARDS